MNGKRLRTEDGFSITELLVAVAVSLILLAGVIQLLVANKQAYRLQEGASMLNENARFAMQRIQHDMRMGSNWAGAAKDAAEADSSVDGFTSNCAKLLARDLDGSSELKGIEGLQGATTSPLDATCIPDAIYVDNSDIIVVRFAEAEPVPSTDPDTTNDAAICDWIGATSCDEDLYLRSAVGRNAIIAQGNDMSTAVSGRPTLNDADGPGIANYRYRAYAFYVRPCQKLSGTTCSATVDDTPTLVRVALDGDTPVHEDLVAGVEQMQALYGVDSDNDGNAEQYLAANSVSDWNRVVSVRVNLLLRELEKDVSYTSDATFGMLDSFTYTVPTGKRAYRRKQYTTVVQIRNLSRG